MNLLENQQMAEGVDGIYQDLEAQLLQNIANHLRDWDQPIATDIWYLRKLAELGQLNQENVQLIARMSGISQTAAERMLNEAAEEAIGLVDPGLQRLAEEGLAGMPVAAKKSRNVEQTVEACKKRAKDTLNLCNTTMLYKAQEAYKGALANISQDAREILNSGAAGVITGAESRGQAVRRCIRQMADKGIAAYVDKRGREWTPEAYVNMVMRNTAKNTADQVQDARIRDAGVNLISIDSHSGARPKCAKDQGKIFDLNNGSGYTEDLHGKKIRYYPWNSSSYGEPDGILGINCRHHKWPFIPGVNIMRYFPTEGKDMDANDRLYKQTQVQRALERDVRKQKRECMMLDAAGDKEGFEEASVKLKSKEAALRDYVDSHDDLHRRKDREQVVGFDKRISAEAVGANKRHEKAQEEKQKAGFSQGSEKKRKIHIPKDGQAYRPVTRGESEQLAVKDNVIVTVSRITSYSDPVYVSEKAKIKPRALHSINKNTEDAMKQWGIPLEKKPKVVIVSSDELGALGKYDAVTDTVYYIPQIADEEVAGELGETEFHEMWHLKQAENYRSSGKKITPEGKGDYLKQTCEKAKKRLDRLGITLDNVKELSDYAYKWYIRGRFDEPEAEYMAKRRRKGKR